MDGKFLTQIGNFIMGDKNLAFIVNFFVKHSDFIFGIIINLVLISFFCKIPHTTHKLRNTLQRHGIIARSPETTHGTMSGYGNHTA